MIFKNQKGFSLIEMMVALVVFAIGLLGLVSLQITAIKANSQAHTIDTANMVAMSAYETIRSMSPQDPIWQTDATGLSGTVLDASLGTVLNQAGGDFIITIDIDANPSGVSQMSDIYIHVESTGALMNVNGNKVRKHTIKCNKRWI